MVDPLAQLYVWGFPLVAVHRVRALQGVGTGVVDRPGLATAADRVVVGPNNDTLYGSGFFDLADGDVTIDVAPFDRPDRYWSVMLLDAYTDVQYVSRRRHGGDASVRVTFDPQASGLEGSDPDRVTVPTRTLWVLVRVLVDGPDDLPAARAARERIRIEQLARQVVRSVAPGQGRGERGSFFRELAHALAVDPPPVALPAPPVDAIERLVSLVDDPGAAPLLAEAAEQGRALVRAAGSGADRSANGWGTRVRGAAFGDDVAYRAAFARVSLAGHLPVENRSYSSGVDGRRPVQLRFPPGGEPPVAAFWSLTMYGPDFFLVDNPVDRYSIGDRTPDLVRDADGGLTIVIGHAEPTDPVGRSNWLPAPDGPGFVALRAYEGSPSVVAAEWFPPPLTPVSGVLRTDRMG